MRTVRFTIDAQAVVASGSETILEVARREGIAIPTLCHLEGLEPAGACLVCLVRDLDSGRMIPACATPPMEGQALDCSGPEVQAARRRSLELLLGDHAGDCEAPCVRACPARLDVPRALRALAGEAPPTRVPAAQACRDCEAPCEKACRRGLHDGALTIRRLMLHATSEHPDAELLPPVTRDRFDSRLGPLRLGELEAFIAGASPPGPTTRTEVGRSKADEARRCLCCDCRAKDTCQLRKLADELHVHVSSTGKTRPTATHPDAGARLAFEPGKCIRCGRCVQITRASGGPALCFLGRSLESTVGAPFDQPLETILGPVAEACAEACPTGAISLRGFRG